MTQLIDAHEWDRPPADRLLAFSLAGPAFATGDDHAVEQMLDELMAAGLVEFRRPTSADFCPLHDGEPPKRADGMWLVRPTDAGQQLGLVLGDSATLVQLLDMAAQLALRGMAWNGVDLTRIVGELDLRAGGDGRVRDMAAWVRNNGRAALQELPRRIDPRTEASGV